MEKKLQVFISSTYTDMIEERQAIVESILKFGHIPAGMELFSANSKKQFDVIKQWIRDSDLFILVLGGKYGSIENKSQKSYIHLEYEYAKKIGKKPIVLVMSDTYIKMKLVKGDYNFQNPEYLDTSYVNFKKSVMDNKLCAFFDDTKSLKNEISAILKNCENAIDKYTGWVKGNTIFPVDIGAGEKCNIISEEYYFEYFDLENAVFINTVKFKSNIKSLKYYTYTFSWMYGGKIRVEPYYENEVFVDSYLDSGYTGYTFRLPYSLDIGMEGRSGIKLFIDNCKDMSHMFISQVAHINNNGSLTLRAKVPDSMKFVNAKFIVDNNTVAGRGNKILKFKENENKNVIEKTIKSRTFGEEYILEWDVMMK